MRPVWHVMQYLILFMQIHFGAATFGSQEFIRNLKHLSHSTFVILILWKMLLCLSGKLSTEFTSPITKSTSPGLSDTTFFAHCKDQTSGWATKTTDKITGSYTTDKYWENKLPPWIISFVVFSSLIEWRALEKIPVSVTIFDLFPPFFFS